MKKKFKNIVRYLILSLLIFSSNIYATGTPGIKGIYTGDYRITVRAHPLGSTLGFGVRNVPWTWDFDKKEVTIEGTTLSVGFNYALHDLDNANPNKDIINFVDNGDGTYILMYQFQIYKPDLGNPRANTTTTFKIIQKENHLEINTIDAESGKLDGILGTQIPGVFPLTIEPSLIGTAILKGGDQNGDGITDEDAIKLGLDPSKTDSDSDGISDVDEIGDINKPKDSDNDGIIDALEKGNLAFNSKSIENIKLINEDTISISSSENIDFQNVSVASMKKEIPNNGGIPDLIKKDSTLGEPGLEYSLGNLTFTIIMKDENKNEISIELKFSKELPRNLVIYTKEFKSKLYTLLPSRKWKKINNYTIKIILEKNSTRDLDGIKNNKIKTSLALAENKLGQIKRKDENAGVSIYIFLILFNIFLFKNVKKLYNWKI